MSISRVELMNSLRARIDNPPPLVEAPQLAPAIDVMALSNMQQAALMTMMVSHVKNALIARLLEDSQDRPGMPEYRDLRRIGFAEWKPGKRLHDLTPVGLLAGRTLQEKLCHQFDIHYLVPHASKSGWETRFSCPCGFSCNVRRSPTAPGNAAVRHASYVRTQQRLAGLVGALKMPTEG